MIRPPKPPAGLQRSGRALWRDTAAKYELARHETAILEQACRCLDTLDALQVVIDREDLVVSWGDGQKINPAVPEARQQRLTLARLLVSLNIPIEDSAVCVHADHGHPIRAVR